MSTSRRFLSMLFILVLMLVVVVPAAAQGGEILVVTVTDTGTTALGCDATCSFQDALDASDTMAGIQTIQFNIPGAGVHTILAPDAIFGFQVHQSVIIDATSQPGYTTQPLIQIHPTSASSPAVSAIFVADQFATFDPNLTVTIRGFAIGGFPGGAGICLCNGQGHIVEKNYLGLEADGTTANPNLSGVISYSQDAIIRNNVMSANTEVGLGFGKVGNYVAINNHATGNFIGTNPTGTTAIPNAEGVTVQDGANNNFIGGLTPADRNIISGNTGSGISITQAATTDNVIVGNFIGTNATGVNALGNGSYGVLVDVGAFHNQIGDGSAEGANVIAHNGADGIGIGDATQTLITYNSIFSNTGLGIDLGLDDITANDANDGDTGSNDLQNYPIVTSVVTGATTVINGTLNSLPSHDFAIELYSSATCDTSGNGEGTTLLDSFAVTTDGTGNATFQRTINPALGLSTQVTAIAIDSDTTTPNSVWNTSEFSPCAGSQADLSITKTDSVDPVLPNGTLSYTLTVTNPVNSLDAQNVTVTDVLPVGITYSLATPSQGTCGYTAGTRTVSCDLTTVNSGSSVVVTVDTTVDNGVTATSISNTASVTSSTFDPVSANNSATETTQVGSADLSISKTDSADPVVPTDSLTYTLTVTNPAGGSNAQTVNVSDVLPAGITYVSAIPSQGTCGYTAGTRTVSCDLGTINSNGSATVALATTVDTNIATPSISNTATVTSATFDPNTADNSATETTQVTLADLSITKTDSADPVLPNDTLTYLLTVTNPGGDSDAQNVTVTDVLPVGITYVLATPSQGTCGYTAGTRTVSCDLGAVNSGAGATVTLDTTVDIGVTAASISNTASVTTTTYDPVSANNSATETTQVGSADLSITKVESVDPVTPGNTLSYTLTVTNPAGGSNAQTVNVTDVLPVGITYVSATPSQGTCGYTAGTRTVSCDLGTINSNSSASVALATTVDTSIAVTTISNTASVTSNTFDPNTADNSATETTQSPHANLSIAKVDSQDPVIPGNALSYTVTVTNPAGGSDAQTVNVTDVLPIGVTYGSATPSQGTCGYTAGTRTVSCDLGTINSNANATITIATTVDVAIASTSINNTATVTSATFDPVSANNSSTATTQVGQSNMRLVMTDAPDPVKVDDLLTYTLTVTNLGPATASLINLTDILPANVALVGAIPSQGTCTPGSGTIACDLGSLNAGSNTLVLVIVRPLNGTQNTTLTNAATVSAAQIDTVPSNNTASASTAIKATSGVPTLNLFTVSTPTLTWNSVTGAAAYEVDVADNAAFLNPVYHNINIAPSTLFVTLPALHDGAWYWRVRARDAAGHVGAWTTNNFVIDVP